MSFAAGSLPRKTREGTRGRGEGNKAAALEATCYRNKNKQLASIVFALCTNISILSKKLIQKISLFWWDCYPILDHVRTCFLP